MIKKINLTVAFMVYLCWITAFAVYNYSAQKTRLYNNLDQQLKTAASNYLNVIPEYLHNKNMAEGDLTKEEDRALTQIYNKFAEKNRVYYVYTMILRDNKVYFTSSNGTEEDLAELEGGYYFYHYPEAEQHVIQSFSMKQPFYHDTHDSWGSFRSVFIPVVSSDGTVFVVGADITTGYIQSQLTKELFATLVIALFFILFALPLFLAFTSQTRKGLEKLKIQTEKAQANESKLKSIVDMAVDAIITIDSRGMISAFNKAACNMFGYARNEAVDKNISLIMPDEFKDDHHLLIKTYLDTSESKLIDSRVELSAMRKDGVVFPIEISVSDVELNDGKRIFTAIIRDLTEKIEKENELRKLIEIADNANKAKSEFLNNMSHELRTPLHGILSYAQIGIEKADRLSQEKITKYFKTIDKSGKRLKVLLDDLLEINKLESGKLDLSFKNIDLKTLIEECVDEQRALFKGHNIDVKIVIDSGNCDAEVDYDRISQVVLNLLNNAFKFSPDNGRIDIVLSHIEVENRHSGKMLEVIVADQGAGVPEDKLDKIFEKFYQLKEGGSKIQGTGLGLAICKELITAHRGEIFCRNRERSGAEIVFRVPVKQ